MNGYEPTHRYLFDLKLIHAPVLPNAHTTNSYIRLNHRLSNNLEPPHIERRADSSKLKSIPSKGHGDGV
jgi:hypothetical protein